jgi:hypothetical protein
MFWDLREYRLVTASAYPGMMAPLIDHASCVCVLSGDAPGEMPGDGPPVLSLESLDGVRRRWRFGDVSRLAEFVPKVLAGLCDDRPVLLVPPRSSSAWLDAAAPWPGRTRIVASDLGVARRIATDKVYVRAVMAALGLPVPEAIALHVSEITYEAVVRRLGEPFVLQAPGGAGGQGTYLVRDRTELLAALSGSPEIGQWLISRYAGDLTINVAGVVHVDGVRMLPPSLQISGIPELQSDFGAYCGSAFGPLDVDARVLARASAHVATIGEWLREMGHRGLFGVDIAVDRDRLALLEVNARVQGSSWLLSSLQGIDEACLVEHCEAILGRPLGARLVESVDVPSGQHLLVRWGGSASRVRGVAPPANAATITGLPSTGTLLQPGALLGRIASPFPLSTPDGHALTPEARSAVAALHESITFEPIGYPPFDANGARRVQPAFN